MRRHLLARGSGGTGIIMASILGSDARLQGGSFEMLELEAVLHREAFDWLLPCRDILFFLGALGGCSWFSGMLADGREKHGKRMSARCVVEKVERDVRVRSRVYSRVIVALVVT